MSKSKPGLADLDVLTPPAPTPAPKAAQPTPEHQPESAAAKPKSAPRPLAKRRQRLHLRQQVVYLTDDQIQQLDHLSHATDRSKAELVREAVDDWLAKENNGHKKA